jgi:hypothetical protein
MDIEPGYKEKFARLVPALVKILRKLLARHGSGARN